MARRPTYGRGAVSCQLYWRPLGNGKSVGDSQLRDAIDEEFGPQPTIGQEALPFLRGLVAAKIDGASELIQAINRHGAIALYKEC
jgi:hypothetical protein